MNQNKPIIPIIITVLLLICICGSCLCLSSLGAIGFVGSQVLTQIPDMAIDTWPNFVPETVPTLDPQNQTLTQEQQERAAETMSILQNSLIPEVDPILLAERLGGKANVPSTHPDLEAPYSIGATKSFWVSNTDSNENFQVNTTLRYVGENVYFWIEDGVRYSESELKNLGDQFDQKIVPTNRAFFGSEWNPGVDNDPHMYVVYAGKLGSNLAGYYSSADELHPDAHPYSNAHEMFLINSDNVDLGDNYIAGTMAHEFQHMIHWYQDKNEETWVNEGFSMLAEHVNGFNVGGSDMEFTHRPDTQLNDWGGDINENGPHYGGSYLFMVYFLDKFGEEATKALVAHQENGFTSIDAIMQEFNLINPDTQKVYTSAELFADWALANLLRNTGIENGRYDYTSYTPISMNPTESVSGNSASLTRDVHQFGTDYIRFQPDSGRHSLQFSAGQAVNLIPFDAPPSGEYFLWSNAADESNTSLTQDFDFSTTSGPISLDFKTWYDLEEDYDFAYISASSDGGKSWILLNSETCTTSNISGNNYGCGWNNQSRGWIDESIDLSAYAGKTVTLRIDYVTDAAVNGKGMAIDDMHIDAINYSSDFENDNGGWNAEGFVRIQNKLPQSFQLSLVTYQGTRTSVQHFSYNGEGNLTIPFEITANDHVILIVSGTTNYTREKAVYQIELK